MKKQAMTVSTGGGAPENTALRGFTLAEVLITLGIIGIVAALTLPTLIQKQQEKETVVKLKKFYTVMDQAIKMSIVQHGEISGWGLTPWGNGGVVDPSDEQKIEGYRSLNAFWDNVLPQLKVIKVCKFGEECKDDERLRYSLDGTAFGTFASTVTLADGADIVSLTVHSPDCSLEWGDGALRNMCGELFVDVNGKKPPNTTGKDIFLFFITKNGIVPMGTSGQTRSFSFETHCNMTKPSNLNGYGCAAWVIYNENMDYLHCNDLAWNGKSKCK